MTDQTEEKAKLRAADRLLARTVRHGLPWLGILGVTALVLACAETALPAVMGAAIDDAIRDGEAGSWLVWTAVLVAVLVIADAIDDLAVGGTTARSTAWIRHSLLHQILELGNRLALRFSAGDVASRLVSNTAQAGRLGPTIVRALTSLIPGVGGIVALAVIHPWLCLTFVAGLPVLVLVVRSFARDASVVVKRYLEVQARIASRLVDALSGARTIAAAGTVDREARRVLAPLPELHRHGVDNWRTQMRLTTQDILIISMLEVAVLAVGGVLLARGSISPGELLAASQYVILGSTIGSAVSSFAAIANARAAAGRVAEVLAEPTMQYRGTSLPEGTGHLRFRDVTVHRAGEPVLSGVDLDIPGGSLAAIVGTSGAGKSLLAGLAGRLVDPEAGEILLDGVPLASIERGELRAAVGYGFERPLLFGETIADAIALGPYEPARDQLVGAARAARADEFIAHMPSGYDTPLASAPMSGGEAQRVGLARSFAHAGRVLILDDVAASLDTVTEHHISEALTGALADRTRLVVARRASTAARADLVVWLDGGRVREVARHEELWREPDYRALFGAGCEHADASDNGKES